MKKQLKISLFILLSIALFSCVHKSIDGRSEDWMTEAMYENLDSLSPIGCRIVAFTGERFNGIIPTTVNGQDVLEIAGKERIKSILPNRKDSLLTTLDFTNAHYLKAIKNDAFYGCVYVQSVHLNKALKHLGNGTFADCNSIQHVEWGNKISYIGEGAFYNNDQLVSITLPDNLDTLGAFSFYACSRLEEVNFNKKLRYIGERAFANSGEINALNLPKKITYIGQKAFLNLRKVNSVVLHSQVTTVEDQAFFQCLKLSDLTVKGACTNISARTFAATPLMTDSQSKIHYTKAANYPEMEHWDQLKATWLA